MKTDVLIVGSGCSGGLYGFTFTRRFKYFNGD